MAAAAAAMWASSASAQTCECDADKVINCGHRGTGANIAQNPFPENTIESMQQAVMEGADMVELDVVHSSDGVLMVIHDDEVDRTTNGTGCVGDMTAAELQALDAGFGTDAEGTGVKIPTLIQVLSAIDIDVNIEIKINDTPACPPSNKPQMAADVAQAVSDDAAPRTIVVSSFDVEVLNELRMISDVVYIGLLTNDATDADLAVTSGFDALNPIALITPDQITDIQSKGLEVNVWTVNADAQMRVLLEAGVDMIITDEPDLLRSIQDELCAEACPDAGAGGAAGAAGSAPDAGPAGTGGSKSGGGDSGSEDDGGCGCRMAGLGESGGAGVGVALFIAWALRRRRCRAAHNPPDHPTTYRAAS